MKTFQIKLEKNLCLKTYINYTNRKLNHLEFRYMPFNSKIQIYILLRTQCATPPKIYLTKQPDIPK